MVLNCAVFDGAISYLMVSLTYKYKIINGVAQEGILSWRFFNVYIDDLSIALSNSKYGCTFGGCSVNHLSYADDMVVLSPAATALQKLLEICSVYSEKHDIYTTKMDGVVCPPNISETVAGRLMKLAHRQSIASTTIKLISKNILLSILSILVKTIQRIVADPKRKLSPPFDSADYVPSLGHPAPGSGKMLSLFTVVCDYPAWVTETGAPVRVKRFSQSEFSSTRAAVARTTFRLDRFRNHSHSAFSCVEREFAVYTLLARCQRQVLRYYVLGLRMKYI